jgi:hypothetical protein
LREVGWASSQELRLTLSPQRNRERLAFARQLELISIKTRQSRRQTAKVSHSRWVAYATAGAATALTASHSAEAAIHYSGIVNQKFPPHRSTLRTFPLDQADDFLVFEHHELQVDRFFIDDFRIHGIASAAFRSAGSTVDSNDWYVSKLRFGQNISSGGFRNASLYGLMVFRTYFGRDFGPWSDSGTGFVGFRFNNGAGTQCGWARVRAKGAIFLNAFEVLDYAYADPGERITAGEGIPGEDDQDISGDQGPDQGSLGGLALGAVGLLAWSKSRSRTARS